MCFLILSGLTAQFAYAQASPRFTALPSSATGIHFKNTLVESAAQNIITYEYFYNGGGVAAGDFNNDGLTDLFFTSNQQPDKLYLNKGGFQFQDITKTAGIKQTAPWKTGVSVADVNGDGFLDIYVCCSGDVDPAKRANLLYINNGNLTFTERGKEYGVADEGYSTQAAFFDFDRDGDLDLFVINHNIKNLRNFDASYVKKMVDPDAGDRLYENKDGHFTDITVKAGIISNPLGYGLGISVADINNDGWPDLYVTNDYVEEDYLYINQHNGTFKESLRSALGHISNFSMGLDIADINNDGLDDIFTLDMLPEDNNRQKLLYAPDNYELYNNTVNNGFYHQLMRNMLQLNNGDGTFSEIGQVAGISNTDWSWSALFADLNNDGEKDLFVTNGYGRDMINRDFMKFYADERLKHLQGRTDSRMFEMLRGIQSTPLHNYVFENKGDLHFRDQSADWGFSELNFSHGAIYADLDNDGDLDLVVNKMNDEAGIYRNNSVEQGQAGNYIDLTLLQENGNRFALGARVTAYAGGKQYMTENYPVHGFQSSLQAPLHITFGARWPDSLVIRWPDGRMENIPGIGLTNHQRVTFTPGKTAGTRAFTEAAPVKPLFSKASAALAYTHQENGVNDFKVEPLMPDMISYSGPRIAKGDVNGDQLEDIYICGTAQKAGKLFLRTKDGSFTAGDQSAFSSGALINETSAVFFDADGDGDKDLYVVAGGFYADIADALQDRLYLNNKGNFTRAAANLPKENISGSIVVPFDADGDGDLDLFVGTRVTPGRYPESASCTMLINDGKGVFSDQTAALAGDLFKMGMVTDAQLADINGDKKPELIVAAQWEPIRAFTFSAGKCTAITDQVFGSKPKGLWNRILLADIDQDGDLDLIAGNRGANTQLHASAAEPLTMYYGDFDNNGFVDPILCGYIQGKLWPLPSRDEMTDQMVYLRQFFPTYSAYADASIDDILNATQKKAATVLQADELHSVWFENVNGKFIQHELPVQADFAPVFAMAVNDYDGDGHPDLLLGGNVEHTRIRTGKIDANYGVLLKGDGKGHFTYVTQPVSGLCVKGCIRDFVDLKDAAGKPLLIIGLNDQAPVLMTY